ncbi:hypothetical protein [Sphingomonas profundi]|uniref:hypothetical protein n=1 Tax=Alterirhizorhabdus profundi TaxID=2681549 RepID=UPI001E4B1355|nr:hypothetical protein [Sphingomonas profundi]
MNIRIALAAAGLVLASLGATTGAEARPHRDDGYHRDHGRHHGWDRGRRGWNDRRYGHHAGYYRPARHCWTEWRHHHRVRVCR